MENDILVLNPAALPTEQNGQPGLLLGSRSRFAGDRAQTVLLRSLLEGRQPVWRLTALLRDSLSPVPDETESALLLARFILDFNDFLEV